MPDTSDADRRPVPHRRTDHDAGQVGLTETPPTQERWTGNWATEHPPAERRSADRTPSDERGEATRWGSRWSGWLAAVLMLAAAGLLFWGPWRTGADGGAQSSNAATATAPSAAPGGQSGAAAGQATRLVDGPIVPTHISIPAIGVNTVVEHHGTVRSKNAFTGETVSAFGVPTSMRTTSWWSDGPEPGSGQMAVILGHTQVGGYGVFNELGRLQPGAPLTLRDANGDTLRLQVLGRPVTGLDKATPALANTLDHHPAGAALALVTCGGQFDRDVHASEDNVVVFASVVPLG